jgi:hypothetical protein
VLLRSLVMMLALSPVACVQVDWAYTDHRSSGESAREGAADLGEGSLVIDLPADIELGEDVIQFKLWPVGDCEGTEDEAALAEDDFPYSVVVDVSCDYKASFALGEGEESEPVEVLGEDIADAGEDGVVVDVQLADAGRTDEEEKETAETTGDSSSASDTATATQPATNDPNTPGLKEFRIPAGTGRGAWNTPQNPIVARVGDVVRIYNDDSIVHQLHTNGRPCGHGSPIQPGSYRECVIQSQFVGDLYDHGTNGRVYWQATP